MLSHGKVGASLFDFANIHCLLCPLFYHRFGSRCVWIATFNVVNWKKKPLNHNDKFESYKIILLCYDRDKVPIRLEQSAGIHFSHRISIHNCFVWTVFRRKCTGVWIRYLSVYTSVEWLFRSDSTFNQGMWQNKSKTAANAHRTRQIHSIAFGQ